jgi:hypothetical protein
MIVCKELSGAFLVYTKDNGDNGWDLPFICNKQKQILEEVR